MKFLQSIHYVAVLAFGLMCQFTLFYASTVQADITDITSLISANNYWECILDDMQGVKNDQAAKAVAAACYSKFPDTSEPVDVSSPLFGAQTRDECFAEFGKEATSFRALKQIRMACHFLYPQVADQDPEKYLQPILDLAE
ncbi:MAG: hypothetical protein K0U68_11040 [Gammaproteobacteria bacterium]|nr:hypothetical protein [Gammaproteobacteria bacterium]